MGSALKVLIIFFILIRFQNSFGQNPNPEPIHFEFHHRESLAISDTDNRMQEEDYDYEDNLKKNSAVNRIGSHSRKRRNAKWSPDYDNYEQWAEEYYEQSEESRPEDESSNQQKIELLDKLINKMQKKTPEEVELESKEEEKRKKILKNTMQYATWVIGIIIIFFVLITIIKKCLKKFVCDFCDAFNYKDKITQIVNNFQPGVYVHKNGKKEYYEPTKEEIEALKDIKKLLYSFV